MSAIQFEMAMQVAEAIAQGRAVSWIMFSDGRRVARWERELLACA